MQTQMQRESEKQMDNTFCSELKTLAQDTELDIFQAERYFKESQDHKEVVDDSTDVSSSTPRVSSVSSSVSGYGRNYTSGSFHATPTASSEASWNSRSGLLSNLPCAVAMRNRRKKKGCYSSKWCFATICPCSGSKSVGVAKRPSPPPPPPPPLHPVSKGAHNFMINKLVVDDTEQIKKMSKLKLVNHQSSWRKEQDAAGETSPPKTIHLTGTSFRDTSGFSFPVLSPGTAKPKRNGKILDDPPRESLEVFQPLEDKENRNKSFDFITDPQTPTNIIDDEIASDASSDLFEIESLSTQTPHRRCSLDQSTAPGIRHSLDGLTTTPSIAPTECYEPSEASIAWSVTTAEGFDGGSLTNMLITASGRCTDSNSCRVQMNAATKTKGNGLSLPVEPRPPNPLQVTNPTGKPPLAISHSTRPMSRVLTRH